MFYNAVLIVVCKRNYCFCSFLAFAASCTVSTADYACFSAGGILMFYNTVLIVSCKVAICCAANFTLCLFCAGCCTACMIFICFNCCFSAIGTNNCSCAVTVVHGIFVCANSFEAVTCENCIIRKSYFTKILISANGIYKSCGCFVFNCCVSFRYEICSYCCAVSCTLSDQEICICFVSRQSECCVGGGSGKCPIRPTVISPFVTAACDIEVCICNAFAEYHFNLVTCIKVEHKVRMVIIPIVIHTDPTDLSIVAAVKHINIIGICISDLHTVFSPCIPLICGSCIFTGKCYIGFVICRLMVDHQFFCFFSYKAVTCKNIAVRSSYLTKVFTAANGIYKSCGCFFVNCCVYLGNAVSFSCYISGSYFLSNQIILESIANLQREISLSASVYDLIPGYAVVTFTVADDYIAVTFNIAPVNAVVTCAFADDYSVRVEICLYCSLAELNFNHVTCFKINSEEGCDV